jgi:hypothetical protein
MGLTILAGGIPQSSIAGTAGSVPVNITPSTPATATAAANTPVTLTIAGVAGQSIRIDALSAGYSVITGTGLLTIVVNSVTIFQCEVSLLGTLTIPLPDGGIECQSGQSAVITLPAGAVTAVGFINAAYLTGA